MGAGKLELLQALCTELGIHTQPKCVSGVWIAPILSWYHASFDTEPDLPGAPDVQKVSQYAATKSLGRL